VFIEKTDDKEEGITVIYDIQGQGNIPAYATYEYSVELCDIIVV
jgi:hypothetical protein